MTNYNRCVSKVSYMLDSKNRELLSYAIPVVWALVQG
jgi:hypothetical protein